VARGNESFVMVSIVPARIRKTSDLKLEHNIDPAAVATLAGILRRSQSKPQQILAKRIMLSASALGDKSATLDLISSALTTGNLHEYTDALQRLGVLAKRENDPQAWTLLGRVYSARNNPKEALNCFRKATRPPTGNVDFYGAGDALGYEGQILMSQDDRQNAKAIFEKAALELDDPAAYFYLSKLQEPGSSQEQVYLLKAASSGIKEAWHNLGALELAKRTDKASKPIKVEDFGMAYEWFQVAAADGFGPSMLNLALMCKSIGDIKDGLRWLDKAEEHLEIRGEVKRIRAQFENSANGAV
jgi:tetratricopeptide (TPR) repeat protein